MKEKIRKFETGATRDTDNNKLDYDGFTDAEVLEKVDNYSIRQQNIAWAAGLFEGEGCIWNKKTNKRKDGTYCTQPALEIKHTDEDVLNKFYSIVEVGKIRGAYWAKKSTKPYWSWQVQGISAYRVICMLIPFMGLRRKCKALEVFGDIQNVKKSGISPLVLESYATYLHKHRLQADGNYRASDNWKKGIPNDVYIKSLWRHLFDVIKEHHGIKTLNGLEDALCAVIFNSMGYLHEYIKMKNTFIVPERCAENKVDFGASIKIDKKDYEDDVAYKLWENIANFLEEFREK